MRHNRPPFGSAIPKRTFLQKGLSLQENSCLEAWWSRAGYENKLYAEAPFSGPGHSSPAKGTARDPLPDRGPSLAFMPLERPGHRTPV